MDNNSQPSSLFSTKTTRVLWVIGVALAVLVLALTLWGWARRGYAWTAFLGPVGLLFLVASSPIARSRPRIYFVCQGIGVSLIIASTVLILREW